jgi:signal transduction histidine kinase/CheY-like chemotaxis protein
MTLRDDEEKLLHSVALQNASSILIARQRAEQEIMRAKDALERKTEELAHSLSLVRATLEATTDGILVTDISRRITDFNERFIRMWRIARDIVDSREHLSFQKFVCVQLKEPQAFLDRVVEIYTSSPAETFDVLEFQDGRVFERLSRIQFLNGRNAGRVWSFRDVTERRRAEEALRDETRILELLHKTGITLSANLDLQTVVQTVTDAATQLSGAQFGAFFYNVIRENTDSYMLYALSGASREAFEKFGQPRSTPLFAPTFKGEGVIRCDDVLKDSRYGKMAPHHGMPPGHLPVRSYLAVPVISRSGAVLGGLFFGHQECGVFGERTERLLAGIAAHAAVAIDNARLFDNVQKAAEERMSLLESERAARSEAERASAMKDNFLANLSHELRTPLSAILGWAHLLQHGARDHADLSRGLDIIERNARAQTQLIEDLLDMSRIASGKIRLDIQFVEPVSFVEAAIETVRPAADARGIRIEKQLDPAAGPISGDPNRLQQIVWNLLSNAIKFTPRHGKVQVMLRRVESQVEIRVSDTGIGIRPEFLPHVFERFRQADASTTRAYGGLGLGLSIVKHLTELHGGAVRVASEGEGLGATFCVLLPFTAIISRTAGDRLHISAPAGASPQFEPADLSGIKVLVVDDERDARDLITRVLRECRAEVLTAATASEALVLVQNERPQILVSDIGMPEVDGYDLLRRIRALGEAKGGKLPAVALTAFARTEDRMRALRAGFLVHVPKPVEPSELVATVASVAGRLGQ